MVQYLEMVQCLKSLAKWLCHSKQYQVQCKIFVAPAPKRAVCTEGPYHDSKSVWSSGAFGLHDLVEIFEPAQYCKTIITKFIVFQ